MRTFGVLAVLGLALAGCGQAAETAPASPAMTAASPAAPQQAPPPPALPRGKAIVDADGVRFDQTGGKTARFAFGTPRDRLEPVATRIFGTPATSANAECGAGPLTFSRFGGLTLNYQNNRLVGWFAEEGAQVVTSDGIAPGKLMRDLQVARSARLLPDSTLEGEFAYIAADGLPIGGFVKGTGRDAKIVSLHAGVNCFFR